MKFLPVVSLVALSVSNVCAQNFDPAPFELTDGFSIIPQIAASVRTDDNIYNNESNTTSSSIFILQPSITFGTDDGINRYGGAYELTSATYSNGSDDNFLDHDISLFAHTEFSAKHRTDFALGFANVHEDRGSGLSESDAGAIDEPIKYNEFTSRGYYQFGGLTSTMRIGGGLEYASKAYQNFASQTKYGDLTELKLLADAEYQVGDVTYLTLDINSTDIEYDHLETGTDSRDSVDSRVLLGLKWEGLAKTTGSAKAGYQHKSFDSENRDSFSGSTVELGLIWQPLQYSTFTANANSAAKDSETVGDYIEELGASVGWLHAWTEQFDTSLQLMYSNDDYVGISRSDDTANMMLNLNYTVNRWLKVTAGYELTNKDSDAADISYDKNAATLGVVVAL